MTDEFVRLAETADPPPPAAGPAPFLRRVVARGGFRATLAAALLFLLAFLPLAFGSISTALFVAAGIVALVQVARGRTPFRFDRTARFAVIAAFAYFALDAAAVILYGDTSRAWVPPVESVHFLLFPFLLAAVAEVRAIDPLRAFVIGARAGALLGLGVALVELMLGSDRVSGGMMNPIPFGWTATLFAFLSLIGIADETRRGRALAVLAFAAGIAASILSESRGGWLAIPPLALVAIVYLGARFGRRAAFTAIGALALAGLAVSFLARDSLAERFHETVAMFDGFQFGRERDTAAPEYSLDQRALMLAFGIEAFADRPLLGYGPQHAVAEVRARAAAEGFTIDTFGHLHNEVLTEIVGNGLVGLGTLLLILAAPVVAALRSARDSGRADRIAFAAMLVTATIVFGLTGQTFRHDLLNTVYVGTLLAVVAASMRSVRGQP